MSTSLSAKILASTFRFKGRVLASLLIALVYSLTGCDTPPSKLGVWKGYLSPTVLYAKTTPVDGRSFHILQSPRVCDVELSGQLQEAASGQLNILLVDEDRNALDLSDLPAGELLSVKGRYWAMNTAIVGQKHTELSDVPNAYGNAGSARFGTIEVWMITDTHGRRMPLRRMASPQAPASSQTSL